MMKEQNTNYAYKLQYMQNPSFDKVRDLTTQFFRELPEQLQNELFESLKRGVDLLDSEPLMVTYLFSYGQMHQAKLNYAFGKLPEEFLQQDEINIIDYGCGQALGTMCYADFLRKNGYGQRVKRVTLIEPSEMVLKRAALHASVFFPNAEIKTINKTFDNLTSGDIVCSEETPTLHILSNVLDMLSFDLERFATLIKENICGCNQFVCVGPYFNYSDKDLRMQEFAEYLNGEISFTKILKEYELQPSKTWTCQAVVFSLGELEENLSTEVTDEDIANGVKDEYGVIYSKDGNRLLKAPSDLPEYSIKKKTKAICNKAFILDDFLDISCITSVFIPNSVQSIGNYAFSDCRLLKSISIPDSVTSIGEKAFCCKELKEIFVDERNRFYDSRNNCNAIIEKESNTLIIGCKNTIIPNSVTSIGIFAFSCCRSLKSISIPNSVTSIGESAFSWCDSLQSITIPDSVTSIGICAFSCCRSLKSISIPNSVTSIGAGVFIGCDSLHSIYIPQSSRKKFEEMLDEELWDKLVEQE